MKKSLLVFAILSVIFVQRSWANGGPVAWTETTPVGAIGLEQNTEVSLKRERLDIKVTGLNTYRVDAGYELYSQNFIDNLEFGVPINWIVDFSDLEPEQLAELAKKGPSQGVISEIHEILKTISITFNGEKIAGQPIHNDQYFKFAQKDDLKFGDNTTIRSWYVAKIKLKKGKNTIALQYDGQLDFEDYQFSKSALTTFDDRKFNYLLYPAGYWSGLVDEIIVSVDPGPYYDYIDVLLPTSDFTRKGHTWFWRGSNVDLKEVRAMVISLSKIVPAAHQLTTWNGQSRVRLNEFAEVRASSELPPVKQITYSAVNVLDGNSQTAWCAGKKSDGGNCYLEFRSKQDTFADSMGYYCSIEGLMMAAGYTKSQKIYSTNNRIKKIAISDCEGKFREVCTLRPEKDYRFGSILIENELPKEAYEKFMRDYKAKHGNDYTHPDLKKAPEAKMDFIQTSSCFRVEILETEAGETGEAGDTCISEMAIVWNCM